MTRGFRIILQIGDDTDAAKMYRINGCKTHPSYDINNNPSYYDIAICQINGTIEFNAKVGPVCLPFQRRYDSFSGSKVTLLGQYSPIVFVIAHDCPL